MTLTTNVQSRRALAWVVLTLWAELLSYPETRANFSKVPSGLALVKTLLSPIRICIDGVEIPVVLVVSPPLLNVSSI